MWDMGRALGRMGGLRAPVGMRGGQHELELHDAGVVLQLPVLDTVELICNVSSPDVNLMKWKGRF